MTGADGVPRRLAERGHARTVVTRLGEVIVQWIGYRSGIKGVPSLFPRDAVLNLPPCGYSWPLQRLAEMFCRSGAFGQAHEFVLAATGVSVGRRQLEQITMAAAADAEQFFQDRERADVSLAGLRRGGGEGPAAAGDLGGRQGGGDAAGGPLSRDGPQGHVARPGQAFARRLGTGQKSGCKRIAETGVVFDVLSPEEPRTPEQIMGRAPGQAAPESPRAANRCVHRGHHHQLRRVPSPPCSARRSAAIPATSGPGSRWWTGLTTRST